jgi:pimeloyl-ACP methyl ester carboxylesterase
MEGSMRTMTLTDGRTLSYDDYGDPDGRPVIFNHGLSDSRLIRHPDEELTSSLGVRIIAADQPGVGASTPVPGRRMVDWGADMAELADSLGLETFAVAGHSGGAPHALSIAHHLPDRVTHGVLASPVGPLDRDGFDHMMAMRDLKLVVRLHRFHHLVRWAYRADVRKAHRDIDGFVAEMAHEDPSDADTFLATPEQRQMFTDNFTAGMQQDEEGIYEMTMALWDWGFDIADVTQRFHVFYGDADDIVLPEMPQQVAQQLPRASASVWAGAGHYGFVDRDRWVEFLGWLTAE